MVQAIFSIAITGNSIFRDGRGQRKFINKRKKQEMPKIKINVDRIRGLSYTVLALIMGGVFVYAIGSILYSIFILSGESVEDRARRRALVRIETAKGVAAEEAILQKALGDNYVVFKAIEAKKGQCGE